jgi:hypothetical protein
MGNPSENASAGHLEGADAGAKDSNGSKYSGGSQIGSIGVRITNGSNDDESGSDGHAESDSCPSYNLRFSASEALGIANFTLIDRASCRTSHSRTNVLARLGDVLPDTAYYSPSIK